MLSTMSTVQRFDRLVKTGKPVYVLNKCNPPAVISLTLTHPRTGEKRFGTIPPTFVPIDLTVLFSRTILKDSYDVRQYMLKGILELVPREKAESILATNRAQEELQRITESKFSAKNVTQAMKALRVAHKDVSKLRKEAELSADDGDETGVSDRVRDICVRMEEQTIKSSQALAELKGLQHTLQVEDYRYILGITESAKMKKWIKARLAELKGKGEENEDDDVTDDVEDEDEDKVTSKKRHTSHAKNDDEEEEDFDDDEE